jgi:transposase InsO family protein
MDQRLQFVADYQRGSFSMTELCARYGVSRKTGYKWVAFYEDEGPAGLADHSRRPEHSPLATPDEIRDALLALRGQHPTWGAKKLLARLRRQEPHHRWPARSTACALLKQAGLVQPRRRSRGGPARPRSDRVMPVYPNAVWTTDFKGQFRTGDHRYCYPLTVMDGYSRYLLDCHGMVTPTWRETQQRFTRLFEEFGLPEVIRSDNGTPFASTALAGLSQLSVWWLQLGIALDRIMPGHPEENGGHERFHRTLKAETACPPQANCGRQQGAFDQFGWEYNYERPHEAIGLAVPGDLYEPSPRAMPARLAAPEYPGHWEVRCVVSNGCFKWHSDWVFLTNVLATHRVGLEPIDDALWTVYFGPLPIGRFDERERRVYETHERPLQLAASTGSLGF